MTLFVLYDNRSQATITTGRALEKHARTETSENSGVGQPNSKQI